MYSLVLLVTNAFHIAFSLTERFTYTLTFEEPPTTILISRFLLDLREASIASHAFSLDLSRPSFVRQLSRNGEKTP
ncbi:hypothetical protein BD414DRAFT_473101 [Trametes punicea]|nr:hypothetical protein BD414DRAFT_473101 [Trametes punicea]